MRHQAAANGLPSLKRQKSTINISRKSDIVQVLLIPNAGGDQTVPQPKAGGGDHNVSQHQKATFEVAKQFLEAIVFTMTLWRILSNEKYWM
jgi:hypothetical protein